MAIKVDFYVLKDDKSKTSFVCQLLQKAYEQNTAVYVHTQDQQSAEQLDEALWTFRDNSFIPHALSAEGYQPPPPIQIGYSVDDASKAKVLLNLSEAIPEFYQQYPRVIEIVDSNNKAAARQLFKDYRDSQCELTTYNV